MKLLQANIWGGRLEPQILRLITEQQPDILCLQEAIDLKGTHAVTFVTVEQMQEAMGADHVYSSPVFTINYMDRKADFANVIISKHPISSSETIFTGKQYVADFNYENYDSNMRNLQHVVIASPDGSDLHVLNHHGHHIPNHKDGDEETMKQCAIIADAVKKLAGKVILCGDFNLSPHSESLEQVNGVLRNLSTEAGLQTTRTNLTRKTEVCDYIFVSGDVTVESFAALDDVVSDHMALVLEFS